jgi:asparagine synthase (glutamine-hydrolysing)
MCRIVGFIDFNFNNSYSLEETITLMRDTLIHGGPDDAGIFIDKDFPVALGHRRLFILDLSSLGHQPMEFENLVITYNGEVYNFKEIRKELEKEGYKFISNSDTEVILKAFHRWGFSAVYKFRGMFAFALWDKKDKKLILCRDRIGVKPLYYYYKNGLFMFASELKAFHKFFNYLLVVVYKLGIAGICLGTFVAYTFLCGVSYGILTRKLKVG